MALPRVLPETRPVILSARSSTLVLTKSPREAAALQHLVSWIGNDRGIEIESDRLRHSSEVLHARRMNEGPVPFDLPEVSVLEQPLQRASWGPMADILVVSGPIKRPPLSESFPSRQSLASEEQAVCCSKMSSKSPCSLCDWVKFESAFCAA
jgi:hypothetical protein